MTPEIADRIAGGLFGLCVGDALGATCEFLSPAEIARRHGRHTEIIGGGSFGWRPGQGTDDSDMAMVIARAYAEGYSLEAVAKGFVSWYRSNPRDIGGTTATALTKLAHGENPRRSGATHDRSAANGSLMRAVASGLVRPNPELRRAESIEISAITHAEPRCLGAVVAYNDMVDALVQGAGPMQAVQAVVKDSPIGGDVIGAVMAGSLATPGSLDTSGYVLGTLGVGVWALCSDLSFEDALVAVVNLGGDADTTGAVAGGLLGARHGASAIPARWTDAIEYGPEITRLVPALVALRSGGSSLVESRPGTV